MWLNDYTEDDGYNILNKDKLINLIKQMNIYQFWFKFGL